MISDHFETQINNQGDIEPISEFYFYILQRYADERAVCSASVYCLELWMLDGGHWQKRNTTHHNTTQRINTTQADKSNEMCVKLWIGLLHYTTTKAEKFEKWSA